MKNLRKFGGNAGKIVYNLENVTSSRNIKRMQHNFMEKYTVDQTKSTSPFEFSYGMKSSECSSIRKNFDFGDTFPSLKVKNNTQSILKK